MDDNFMICHYRHIWEQHISEKFANAKYDHTRLANVPAAVGDQIATSLDFSLPVNDPRRLRLGQPYYTVACNREQLERMLRCLAVQNLLVGFRKAFAGLCAAVLAVLGDEKKAFKLCLSLNEGLQLSDYHAPIHKYKSASAPLQQDAYVVYKYIKKVWPDITEAFDNHDLSHHLHSYIERLLSTCLTAIFNRQRQPFSRFIPMLHRLITAKPCPQDPRKGLRYLVVCVVASHCEAVKHMATAEEINLFCNSRLKAGMGVSRSLIELVDSQLDYSEMALGCALAYGGLGMYFGGMVGLGVGQVSTTGLGLAGKVGAAKLSAVSGAAVTGMCVGGTFGGVACFCYGYSNCLAFVRRMTNDIINGEDDDFGEEIDSPQPSSVDLVDDIDAEESSAQQFLGLDVYRELQLQLVDPSEAGHQHPQIARQWKPLL